MKSPLSTHSAGSPQACIETNPWERNTLVVERVGRARLALSCREDSGGEEAYYLFGAVPMSAHPLSVAISIVVPGSILEATLKWVDSRSVARLRLSTG